MPVVKSAISLDKNLFDKVNKLAGEMNVSRSRIFILAAEEYLKKQENRKLFEEINASHENVNNMEERKTINSAKQRIKET